MERERAFSGAPWEAKAGYCRAVRAGDLVFVSGTAPYAEDGSVHAPGDACEQTRRCFTIVKAALEELGADLSAVVRTRMYTTDISLFEEICRAHAEFFGDHPPASTLVEVSALVDPEMLIEVEVDAVVAG